MSAGMCNFCGTRRRAAVCPNCGAWRLDAEESARWDAINGCLERGESLARFRPSRLPQPPAERDDLVEDLMPGAAEAEPEPSRPMRPGLGGMEFVPTHVTLGVRLRRLD